MVYMHFPSQLTEEEKILQKKYAKLKKKKQAMKAMRAPKPEPTQPAEEAKKRSYERAADATEEAKKLLKSGIIKVGNDRKEQREFKRTKRQKDTDRSTVGFQPFQASQSSDHEDDKPEQSAARKTKSLFESFVSSRESRMDHEEETRDRASHRDRAERSPRDREDRPPRSRDRRDSDREPPRKGNTIYINGSGIQEELIKKNFSNFGTIINISMEQEKNCGFVTFEKMESADEAITQMNGGILNGVQLKVSMARRQPNFEQTVDPASSCWAAMADNHNRNVPHKDKRDLVSYNEDFF